LVGGTVTLFVFSKSYIQFIKTGRFKDYSADLFLSSNAIQALQAGVLRDLRNMPLYLA